MLIEPQDLVLIAPLPTTPSRSMSDTEFVASADAWVSAQADCDTQRNAQAQQLNSLAQTASDSAGQAQASAGYAAAVSSSVKWMSSVYYAAGACAWDPNNLQTYRAMVDAPPSATPPSQDPAKWRQLYPSLDSSCALNYGLTFQGLTLPPLFRMLWGGASDTTWKKIATVTLTAGTYRGAAFKIEVYESWYTTSAGNKGTSYSFDVVLCRSEVVELSPDNAVIEGDSTGFLRVVKTQADAGQSVYEIQARQETNFRHMELRARRISSSGASIVYVNSETAGSSTGTVYTPTLRAVSAPGGVRFGNVTSTDPNVPNWYEKGDFDATASGGSAPVVGNIKFVRFGSLVVMSLPVFSLDSNAASFTLGTFPTTVRPIANRRVPVRVRDNGGTIVWGHLVIGSNGVCTVYKDANSTTSNWTATTSSKVLYDGDVSYTL